MMRRYIPIVAAALSIIAANPALAKPRVIRLTSVKVNTSNTKTGSIDHDSDRIGSRVIGHDTVTCTATGKNSARCKVTFVRPSFGNLYLSFRTTFTASSGHGIVTGGTRAYAGATGTFSYKSLNKSGSRTAVVVMLK